MTAAEELDRRPLDLSPFVQFVGEARGLPRGDRRRVEAAWVVRLMRRVNTALGQAGR